MRVWSFFTITTTLLVLATAYLARRANHSVEFFGRRPWLAYAIGFGLAAMSLYAHRVFWSRDGGALDRPSYLLWATYLWLGFFVSLLVYALVVDLGLLSGKAVARLAGKKLPIDAGKRAFLAAAIAAGGSFLVGTAQAARGPRVREIEIPIEGLPPSLHGFRILQITDLHVGPLIDRAYVERVVEMAMGEKPDLIVLTGDMVDGNVEQLRVDMEPHARLQAPHGVYFVTGNHDFYSGAREWMSYWESIGVVVLANEHALLRVGDAALVVAGIHDATAGRRFTQLGKDFDPNPEAAFRGAPADATKIFLAHQPRHFEEAERLGAQLQISGHTHAGQFIPWRFFLPLVYRYYAGLNRHGKMWVYVGAGAGWWGPPNRFGIPSEIAVLRLVGAGSEKKNPA